MTQQHVQMPAFPIIDFHLHFPVRQDDWLKPYRDRFVARYGQARWDERAAMNAAVPSWLPDYGFPAPEEPSDDYDAVAARWRAEALRYGLERVVFLTGGGNEPLARIVSENADLFSGFAHHGLDEPGAADTLERAIQSGLCGYKILAPVVEKPLAHPDYADVFAVCHEYGLPVLIHFGILGGGGGLSGTVNFSPLALGEVAARYPRAQFIVPHFGCGFPNDLLTVCWACPNVSVDTSGNNLWTKWTMENYTLQDLFARFYATVGPERILFGTDSEWFPRGFALRYLMDQYGAVKALNWPQADINAVFHDNALRLLDR